MRTSRITRIAVFGLFAAALSFAQENVVPLEQAPEQAPARPSIVEMAGPDSAAAAASREATAAGTYERKSISWLDAIWIVDRRSQEARTELLDLLRKGMGGVLSNPRFDQNPLPEAIQRRFVLNANALLSATSADDRVDVLTERVNRHLLPEILGAVEASAEARAVELLGEEERNSRIVDKAKELGITSVELDKVRNAAYVVVPMIRRYNAYQTPRKKAVPSVTVSLEFGAAVWRIRVENGKAEAVPVKFVWSRGSGTGDGSKTSTSSNRAEAERSAAFSALTNIEVEIRSIPDFRMTMQVSATRGNEIESQISRSSGLRRGDKYLIVKEYEKEDGTVVAKEEGWVRADRISSEDKGYTVFDVVAGSPMEGDVLREFPRVPVNFWVGGGWRPAALVHKTRDGEGKKRTDTLAVGAWIAHFGVETNGINFRLGVDAGFGVASLRGAGRRFNPDPARIPREDEGLRLAWTPEAHLNFRWYVPWRRVSLYAGLEVGWEAFLFNKPEWVEEDFFDEEEEDVYGKQAVEVGAGAGVEVALSPAFSLRAGLRYHLDLWIDDEDLDYGTEVDSPNLSVEAQIVWNPPSLNFF